MDYKKFDLTRDLSLSVPLEDADRLLKASDGGACLLYLYLLRNSGELSVSQAAGELKRTEGEILSGCEKLIALGIMSEGSEMLKEKKLRPAQELPEYSARDVVLRSAESNDFQAVLSETQRIFGRVLSSAELKTLFGIYDYLALPAEVMLMLIHHCVEECREQQGPGRLPTMKRIEKEAYNWSDNEIMSLDLAEEHIKRRRRHRDDVSQVKEILQIRGRELSSTERKYVESWLGMGFGPEALYIAYDRTILKTGSLQWKYMNTIVESWHGKGLHTPSEIEERDVMSPPPARRQNGRKAPPDSSPQKEDLDRMKRILDKVKNG